MYLPTVQPQAQEGDPDGNDASIIVPSKVIADSFDKKEHSWLVRTQMPTDLSVQVQDTTFTVHKYPLVSKSGYISRIELEPSISKKGHQLKLENFPGGPETFEIIMKFCYGLPLDLSPNNVAPLRCASEFLEMNEELEEGNLISKTETFLTFIILSSWKDTITVLKSCEDLSPWAENLQIVRRCCDSVAWKASRDHPMIGNTSIEEGWWFESVATLRIDYFVRIVTAMNAKRTRPEIIGKCIMQYAAKWLPGIDVELEGLRGYGCGKTGLKFSVVSGMIEAEGLEHIKEQKSIIESLVSILPAPQQAVPCKFLLNMLKLAIVYSTSPALISELEKRVGMVLDMATVNDLLIPNCKSEDQGNMQSPEEQTMYNIDIVQRIIEYFLMHEQEQHQQQPMSGILGVSKLLDNYLAEVARDPNLSIAKFHALAEALPESARTCDDGLYRAIDTYLKTHPSLSEHDRRRLCKGMNCDKLSLDACMHVAQNDRLPLRTVVKVLFLEQVKMRKAMEDEKEQTASGNTSEEETSETALRTEMRTLGTELENVKTKMAELQKDYCELQQQYEKLHQKNMLGWAFSWRKMRRSSHFHAKNEEVTDEGKHGSSSLAHKLNLRRRQSIS